MLPVMACDVGKLKTPHFNRKKKGKTTKKKKQRSDQNLRGTRV